MPPQSIQISIVGDAEVGKASLVERLACGTFEQSVLHRNELDVKLKENLKFIKLPATQPKAAYRSQFYPMTNIFILMFSLDKPDSFKSIKRYHKEITQKNSNATLLLVGNKADRTQTVKVASITSYCEENELSYFSISVQDKRGLPELKEHIDALLPSIQAKTSLKEKKVSTITHRKMISHRQQEAQRRYQAFWEKSTQKKHVDPNLDNIRALLADYCAYIPPSCFPLLPSSFISKIYLLFTGHWRHHIDSVRDIVTDIDNKTLQTSKSVINRLDTLRNTALQQKKFNRQGSLSLSLSFIKQKCATTAPFQDDDATYYRKPLCCAI